MKKHLLFIIAAALLMASCDETKPTGPNANNEPKKAVTIPSFNADSAYQFVAKQTQFGPRVPETFAHAACAEWLTAKLSEWADTVIVQEFRTRLFNDQGIDGKNIVAVFNPEAKKRIVLCAHWDSRPYADHDPDAANTRTPIDGANDGASGVGVLMECARQFNLQALPEKLGIDIEMFDIVNEPVELKAVSKAVQLVHDGDGDVLMKGLCSTDKFLRAILNKETGLLPPKGVLSHVGIIENPNYHKLMFLSDMAVIPLPDFRQKVKIANYLVGVAKSFGIAKPKIAFIAASEQMLDSMPACIEAAQLAKMCDRGQIKGCVGDGPLALDVAIDEESVQIKKLVSPVAGDADCLQFPNIESANVFWKTNSKLATGVRQAGMLVGTTAPCVLASRADSVDTKLISIAEAVMFVNK